MVLNVMKDLRLTSWQGYSPDIPLTHATLPRFLRPGTGQCSAPEAASHFLISAAMSG